MGEKVLPENIRKWLPVSTDLFFGQPLVINACYAYVFIDEPEYTITNIICSKEFIKFISVAKKIFSNYG